MRALWNKLVCVHNYTLLNQFTMESEFDMINASRYTPRTNHSLTRRTITDYKCEKCGKLKRFTAKTAR